MNKRSGLNKSSALVYEFFTKKSLAALGYSFDASGLSQFEVEAYTFIDNEVRSFENKQMKLKKK